MNIIQLEQIKDPCKYVQSALDLLELVLPKLPQEYPEPPSNNADKIFEYIQQKMHEHAKEKSGYHKEQSLNKPNI